MTFPLIFLEDYSLWMNWVSTIGAMIILIITILVAIFYEDHDQDSNAQFSMAAGIIGIGVAVLWGFAWPLIVIIGGILLFFFLIRVTVDKIRDSYFYYRYER